MPTIKIFKKPQRDFHLPDTLQSKSFLMTCNTFRSYLRNLLNAPILIFLRFLSDHQDKSLQIKTTLAKPVKCDPSNQEISTTFVYLLEDSKNGRADFSRKFPVKTNNKRT